MPDSDFFMGGGVTPAITDSEIQRWFTFYTGKFSNGGGSCSSIKQVLKHSK